MPDYLAITQLLREDSHSIKYVFQWPQKPEDYQLLLAMKDPTLVKIVT